jgi:hypothetical protein
MNGSTISPAGWVHIIIAYDAGSASNTPDFYINGAAQTTNQDTGAGGTWLGITTDHFDIGSLGKSTYWNGYIDNVMIYNKEIIAAEAAAIYENGRKGANPIHDGSLVAHYKLGFGDPSDGSSFLDSSGNERNSTSSENVTIIDASTTSYVPSITFPSASSLHGV